MTAITTQFTLDGFTEQLDQYVDLLYCLAKSDEKEANYVRHADGDTRNTVVDRLCDAYISVSGKRPESAQLDRLASLLLRDTLTDKTPWKSQNTEYPAFTERILDDKGILGNPEGSIDLETVRKENGFRRALTVYDGMQIDSRSRSRNKEARKRYLDFIKGRSEGGTRIKIAD